MAITGDINVTIYKGDRSLWDGGKVNMMLIDPFSNTEKVIMRHSTAPKTKTILLMEVPADRGQNYSLLASAKGCRGMGVFPLKPRPQGLSHTALMLVAKDPVPDFTGFTFEKLAEQSPQFFRALDTGLITEAAFLGLAPEEIAGSLNIEAKLRSTMLDGIAAIEFIRKIDNTKNILRDRIFAWVDKNMPDQVRREIARSDRTEGSSTFEELPEWANNANHQGYPLSFKQRMPFGSIQLSFAVTPVNDFLAADIDIDLYYGVSHVGEVLRNKITEQKTDPYTVYIQLFNQRIFPLYVLQS